VWSCSDRAINRRCTVKGRGVVAPLSRERFQGRLTRVGPERTEGSVTRVDSAGTARSVHGATAATSTMILKAAAVHIEADPGAFTTEPTSFLISVD